jgi:hypothetical protein
MNSFQIVKPQNYIKSSDLLTDFKLNGFVSIKSLISLESLSILREELTKALQMVCENERSFSENVKYLDSTDKSKLYEFHNATIKLMSHSIFSYDIYKVLNILNENKPLLLPYIYYLLGIPKDNRLAYDFHQ